MCTIKILISRTSYTMLITLCLRKWGDVEHILKYLKINMVKIKLICGFKGMSLKYLENSMWNISFLMISDK